MKRVFVKNEKHLRNWNEKKEIQRYKAGEILRSLADKDCALHNCKEKKEYKRLEVEQKVCGIWTYWELIGTSRGQKSAEFFVI